jgi:hypothetical protein
MGRDLRISMAILSLAPFASGRLRAKQILDPGDSITLN